MKSFSIQEALRFGWNAFKRDAWIYVGATLILLVVSAIIDKLSDGADVLTFIISIAGTVLTWWLTLGLVRMTLASHAGLPVKVDMLFRESWDVLWRYAVAMIVSIIIIVIGLVLLIIPGIIAQVALSLVTYLVLEKGMKPIEALKESRRMTAGKRWDIFLFFVVIALINIVGAIAFFVGLLVTIPVTLLAFAYVYKKIDTRDDMQPMATHQMPLAPSMPSTPAAMV